MMDVDPLGLMQSLGGGRPPQLPRLLKALDRALSGLGDRAGLDEALTALMEIVEATHPGICGSILLVDESGLRVRTAAAPHLPDYFVAAIDGIEFADGVGTCGTAMARGEPIYCEDILSHPDWATFTPLMRRTALRACWSYPIRNGDGAVIGSIAMYYDEPRAPTPEEVKTIETSAVAVARLIALSGLDQPAARSSKPS